MSSDESLHKNLDRTAGVTEGGERERERQRERERERESERERERDRLILNQQNSNLI